MRCGYLYHSEVIIWRSERDRNRSYFYTLKQNKKEVRYMKMNYAAPIIDGYNAVVGTIVAVLSYILGDHWILFLAFLLLNLGDWLTGWMKSRLAGKENSVAGWKGVLKKLGYWLMVMVAFGHPRYLSKSAR